MNHKRNLNNIDLREAFGLIPATPKPKPQPLIIQAEVGVGVKAENKQMDQDVIDIMRELALSCDRTY